jgi:PhnB protein
MMADEFPEIDVYSPAALGGCTAGFVVYVPDVDAAVERAVARGATQVEPIEERYGARAAWIVDPYGHRWNIGTAVVG